MSFLRPPRGESIERLLERLETVSDWQVFGFTMLWVIGGGLFLQLVILPYVIPQAHGGHGLIASQDSMSFHFDAVEMAKKIRAQGWSAWQLTETNYSIALAGAIYAVTYPEPWVVLPVNGLLFALAMVAVRRMFAVTFDSGATGLIALTPFFIFPSFVPIWGQLHRDLNTGAGFSLVLCGLVLAAHKGRRSAGLVTCAAIALAGMGLLWLSRSYSLAIIAAGTMAFVVLAILTRRSERLRVCVVAAVVLLAAASSVNNWTTRLDVQGPTPGVSVPSGSSEPSNPSVPGQASTSAGASHGAATTATGSPIAAPPPPPPPPPPKPPLRVRIAALVPRVPHVNPSAPRIDYCLPVPTSAALDRLFYSLCRVREGFMIDSKRLRAASALDYDVRLRTARDFIAYAPRGLEMALLEPRPERWGKETTPIGRLGRYFVPFEMIMAYSCFILAALLAYRSFKRLDVWALVAFCVTYALIYALATSQLGTLYRMRAFAFAIVVSTALAALVTRLQAGHQHIQ